MLKYEPKSGEDFSAILENMIALAKESNQEVEIVYKRILITVNKNDTLKSIETRFSAELIRRHEKLINSPEYREKERGMEDCRDHMPDAKKRLKRILDSKFKRSVSWAAKKMTLKNNKHWRSIVAMKNDGCGGRLIRFVERWARFMEGWITVHGGTVEECANLTWHLANTEDIPESKFGDAVLMLREAQWIYGEELDYFYNKPPVKLTKEDKKKTDKHYRFFKPILH